MRPRREYTLAHFSVGAEAGAFSVFHSCASKRVKHYEALEPRGYDGQALSHHRTYLHRQKKDAGHNHND